MTNGPSLYVDKGELVSPVSPPAESLNATSLPQICEAEQCRTEDQEVRMADE
jgi:hypothetical protein